jgi:hypothetical protein
MTSRDLEHAMNLFAAGEIIADAPLYCRDVSIRGDLP